MGVSQYLKEAKSLFFQGKFDEALQQLNYHLEDEPEDVRALVLKGATEQRLHEDEKSIATFKKALEHAPQDTTIWKGLIRTYFQAKMYDEYFGATTHVLYLIATAPDADKHYEEALNTFERCQQFISKAKNAPAGVLSGLLELQLPLDSHTPETQAIYDFFDGRIFPNYGALKTLIQLRRKELASAVSKIAARRKTSINFSAKAASKHTLDAISHSNLRALLQLEISIEDDDEARREAEAELLRLLISELTNLPQGGSKTSLQAEVRTLVEGMAMFEPRTPLALELAWDWESPSDVKPSEAKKDIPDNSESSNEVSQVEKYVQLFPSSPLGKVLAAHMSTKGAVKQLTDIFKQYKGDSVFAWTIISSYLLGIRDYKSTIDAVRSGLEAIEARRNTYGMSLKPAELSLKLDLANAYSYFETPKNYEVALDLYDQVLTLEPDSESAKIGKGLVLSHQGRYEGAFKILEDVIAVNPDNVVALSELSWCRVRSGDVEEGIRGLQRSLTLPTPPTGQADIKWRIGYSLWTLGKREESFEMFLATLQEAPAYASAYTYLGLFYSDVAHDTQRAKRCFYKALDIDKGQVIAGYRLAADFAAHKQWNLVEVIAASVISSGKLSGERDVDWPYRALGIVCINGGRYAEAVKYFQKCLRSRTGDTQAWVGLGEAYIYTGRYHSAEKALKRALKLDPSNFSALYISSLAHRAVLDFPSSTASLREALKHTPQSFSALLWALADNSLRAAEYFASESRLGDALDEVQEALKAILQALNRAQTELDSSVMWGAASEALMFLHRIGRSYPEDVPTLKPALQSLKVLSADNSSSSELIDLACSTAARYVELASKEKSKARRAASHFCAAVANSMAQRVSVAIEHFKAVITLEPKNDRAWSAYATCLQNTDPIAAQHCYVRSLTLNGRSEDTWVNLAGLYIMLNDPELAAEAIDRALSLDPDNCRAWIGQALIETMQGSKSADHLQRMLEYAYSLTNNDKLASYAMALQDYKAGVKTSSMTLGALEKLLAVDPRNHDGQLLMGLILEQSGEYDGAVARLEPLNEWCHVARVQLAQGNYEAAIEAAKKNTVESHTAVLSELLVTGLAYYFLNDFEAALETLMLAIEHENTEDVLRLLVEVLYANGTAEAHQVAYDQLFDSISTKGPTLQVTLLLGVLGLLNKDETVIEAARSELKSQMTPDVHGEPLAQACHILSLLEDSNASFQRALFQWPTNYALWRRVDKQQALLVAESRPISASVLSRAHTEAGGVTNCQRAVFFEPTSEEAWTGLARSFTTTR